MGDQSVGMRLKDKCAIVTGGGNGIGKAYCLALVREGASVGVADIDKKAADAVAETIRANGGKALSIETDISIQDSVHAMADRTAEAFGGIDILVNNAAIFSRPAVSRAPFWEISMEEWDRVMQVNIKGPWLCSCAVLPYLRKRGKGKIINQSSVAFHLGLANYAHYVASRAAIVGMTRSMARELGPYLITVNSIAPGSTLAEDNPSESRIQNLERASSGRSIKRIEYPEDLVGSLIFLASKDSDFITGQTFVVDGGAFMQ